MNHRKRQDIHYVLQVLLQPLDAHPHVLEAFWPTVHTQGCVVQSYAFAMRNYLRLSGRQLKES